MHEKVGIGLKRCSGEGGKCFNTRGIEVTPQQGHKNHIVEWLFITLAQLQLKDQEILKLSELSKVLHCSAGIC